MVWQAAKFREYFTGVVGAKETSANSYAVNLRKLDAYTGGLDEKIAELGFQGVLEWAKDQTAGPFEDYNASNVRSALKRYVAFLVDATDPETAPLIETPSADEGHETAEATVFKYERELQAGIRRQLNALEPGLVVADGGVERSVATGRIDILAEDATGGLVVIELKAGTCPAGALEQALGYTSDIAIETSRQVRTILVAADFPERIRSAARRVRDLKLVTYKLQLAFEYDPLD
jgi:hypothetical protein